MSYFCRLGGLGDDTLHFFRSEDVVGVTVNDHTNHLNGGYTVFIKLRGGHTIKWEGDETVEDVEETLGMVYPGEGFPVDAEPKGKELLS